MAIISVNVKLLNERRECNVTIDSNETAAELKAKTEVMLGLSANRQKLIFNGKPLSDEYSLANQGVKDGARLHVIVQRPASSGTMDPHLSSTLHQFLRPHFTEPDCKLIVHYFDKKLTEAVERISLEDIERLASLWTK